MTDDPYSSIHYRSVIAWPQRLAREWPFLEAAFSSVPSRRILDLGCGTGEHAAVLASKGYDVVGIDSSPSMLDQARQAVGVPNVRFVEGDITQMGHLACGVFGGAICLGNTLPHISGVERLEALARGLREHLADGGVLVLQVLNYEKIFARGQRYLPPTFRVEGDEEVVFLRLMDPRPDGRTVIFCPSTLRYRRDSEQPLEVVATRRVVLRGWRSGELAEIFARAGFHDQQAFGAYDRSDYDPMESPDLILVAR